MLKETNLSAVKDVAKMLLMTDIHKTEFSPAIVQHPFTYSAFVGITQNDETLLLNLLDSEENLKMWQQSVMKHIDTSENAYQIYMMVNKPYALTFLKYAMPYLTQAEFSEILGSAWIASENPNMDVNIGTKKFVSMFHKADPAFLMNEHERRAFDLLENPVTVYRGVTQYNSATITSLSWTLDPKVANWFAHRYGEEGTVYEAVIDKNHILALFLRRNESEVIVDPSYLTELEESTVQDCGISL